MKYIIEIEDVPFSKVSFADTGAQNINLYRARGFNALVFDQSGLDKLTPLDKALSSELGEAYHKGLEEGKKQTKVQAHLDVCHDIERVARCNYQKGLDDAWECARRLVLETSLNEAEHMGFIAKEESAEILRDYTVTAAMKAVELYDEKPKAKIKVGDEVAPINALSRPFVVVSVRDNVIHGFDLNGGCTSRGYFLHETHLKKTGRHFPQVAELLKAMKEGAE